MKKQFKRKRELKQAKANLANAAAAALPFAKAATASYEADKRTVALTVGSKNDEIVRGHAELSKADSLQSAQRFQKEIGDTQSPLTLSDWDSHLWLSTSTLPSGSVPEMFAFGLFSERRGAGDIPACLPNPATANVALRPGRIPARLDFQKNLDIAHGLIVRMLMTTPNVKISFIDPKNLGSAFSSFGKADIRNGGVFEGTAVSSSEIDATLRRLADRIHFVSGNFLQGAFTNLRQYNKATATPEDTHVLVALNPETYNKTQQETLDRLTAMGSKCGVHVLEILGEEKEPSATDFISPERPNITYNFSGGLLNSMTLSDYGLLSFPYSSPSIEIIEHAISVAETSRAAASVSLELDALLNPAYSRPGKSLEAIIGKTGTQPFTLELGVVGAHPHLLIAGRTGSGKSTLLHSLIASLASAYSPEDLSFYLVDGKQGVEMRNYAPLPSSPAFPAYLPHVKIAAVKSDIRTYISVLEKAKADIKAHAKVCANHGVSDVVALAEVPGAPRLPRIVVILDEFHVLLTDPDFGDTAASLLKDLVKQGRAYGIHIVLATQSLGNLGATAQNAAIFREVGNRIALACDASVSEQILGQNNIAASRLSRLGEAVFSANVGSGAGNVPLQVAYLEPSKRTKLIQNSFEEFPQEELPFVFSGDSLPSITTSPIFDPADAGKVWLGSPVKISGPVSTRVRSLPSGNILFYGSGEEDGSDLGGAITASALSLLKTQPDASFIIGVPSEESPTYQVSLDLAEFLSTLGVQVQALEAGRPLINRLKELEASLETEEDVNSKPTFLVIADGDDSLRSDDLKIILAKGPERGLHTLVSFSSKRTLLSASGVTIFDKALNLFDSRIFATLNSAETSASTLNLPEKPANEESRFTLWDAARPNKVEVFIPYAAPDSKEWASLNSLFKSALSGGSK